LDDVLPDIVKLNVGGTMFQSTWDTLSKDANSMLNAMFAGTIPVKLDENGCVFIDRDGKVFKNVLKWLRNGTIDIPTDQSKCYDLLKEAEFYQLSGLADLLKEALEDYDTQISSLNWSSISFRMRNQSTKVGKQVIVVKSEADRDLLVKTEPDPMVILEVSSSSFVEEKDAIIYKHLVLFDKLSSDYGDKILFVKQIVYTGKEWKFYAKGKLQHSIFFYNQYNGKHSFQEEIILDRILKLFLLKQ